MPATIFSATMTFPTTRWTIIQQAISQPTAESCEAWETLCNRYMAPVQAYIAGRIQPRDQAEDLCQEFFTRLIGGDLLKKADPGVGRFRSFLLHAVRCFLADMRDHQNAIKRGGRIVHVTLETNDERLADGQTPDLEFERVWARTVLSRALDKLGEEHRNSDRATIFEALQASLDGQKMVAGKQMAARLGLSETALRVAFHRLRKRLGQLIRAEIADTVPAISEIDDELIKLKQALEKK